MKSIARIEILIGMLLISGFAAGQVPTVVLEWGSEGTGDGDPPLSDVELIGITVTGDEDAYCETLGALDETLDDFYVAFELEGPDFDGDLLPEAATLALIQVAACTYIYESPSLIEATQTAFEINLHILEEESVSPAVDPYRELIAALMLSSAGMEDALVAALANNGEFLFGDYENVSCIDGQCMPQPMALTSLRDWYLGFSDSVRAVAVEPYSAKADLDGDGVTNLEEYLNTIANGGTIEDFALAALDAALDGTGPFMVPDPPPTQEEEEGGGGDGEGGGAGGDDGETGSGSDGGGACFIATAAFGTPLASEIGVLREFRDQHLLTNPLGAMFVDCYYRMSPRVADFVAERGWVGAVVRIWLVPVILVLGLDPWVVMAVLSMLTLAGVRAQQRRMVCE